MTKEELIAELTSIIDAHSNNLLKDITGKFFPEDFYYPKLDEDNNETETKESDLVSDTTWTKAINLTLSTEGGYVNDPNDAGGETNWGISKRSYPNEDIKNMTRERAVQIYKENYWDKCKCESLPDNIAIALFSCAVNCGQTTAIKILQGAIGVNADGIVGNLTINASKKEGSYNKFIEAWIKKYFDIVSSNASQMKFLRGWVNRVVRVILGTYV